MTDEPWLCPTDCLVNCTPHQHGDRFWYWTAYSSAYGLGYGREATEEEADDAITRCIGSLVMGG